MSSDNRAVPVHLELGCGSSGLILEDRPVIGVDQDLDALRIRSRRRPDHLAVCADATRLPCGDGTAWSIGLHAVLHHLPDLTAALGEFHRVLVPGGRLEISDGTVMNTRLARTVDRELRAAGRSPEPRYGIDPVELVRALSECGFEVVERRREGVTTFATPPYVSQVYATPRFVITSMRKP